MNTNIKKVAFGAGLLCLCASLSQAKDKKVKMADLPAAVQNTVKEQSKGAKLRGLVSEVEKGKTVYEAKLTVNGHHKDVSIDADGKVIDIEEVVPLASVPAAAKAAIEQAAGKGKILRVEAVSQGDKVVAYEAAVKLAGKKSEVRVDPDGKPAPEQ